MRSTTVGGSLSNRSAPPHPETLAILCTMTTYGSWLRGDGRGWVDHGRVCPPDPQLQCADRQRMQHRPFAFSREQLYEIGDRMGTALINRLDIHLFALTVQRWHVHFVTGQTRHPVGQVIKCAKEAVRYHLRVKRPIWTGGYDKRFCFDEQSVITV